MYQSRALKKESVTIFLRFSCCSIKNIDPLLQASANFWNWWVERSYKIRNWLKYGRKGGRRKTMLSAAFARVLLRGSASVYRDTVLAPINRRPNHSESPSAPTPSHCAAEHFQSYYVSRTICQCIRIDLLFQFSVHFQRRFESVREEDEKGPSRPSARGTASSLQVPQ